MVRFFAALFVAYVCLGLGAFFGGAAGFTAFHFTNRLPNMSCGTGPAIVMFGYAFTGMWCGLVGGGILFLGWLIRSIQSEE